MERRHGERGIAGADSWRWGALLRAGGAGSVCWPSTGQGLAWPGRLQVVGALAGRFEQ